MKDFLETTSSENSIKDARLLLIPAISTLATYLDVVKYAEETKTDLSKEIKLMENKFKESFRFALEQRLLLCP